MRPRSKSKSKTKSSQANDRGVRREEAGWTYIAVRGPPRRRGAAYGRLMAEDMREVMRTVRYITLRDMGVEWDVFVRAGDKYLAPVIRASFPEFYEEMQGFAEGAGMDPREVLAWNNYFTLTESWWSHLPEEEALAIRGSAVASVLGTREGGGAQPRGQQERCTAFIAVGKDWTRDGGIVCGHNNFSNFADGQFARYVLDIAPTDEAGRATGHRILMVAFPGWIWSGTDFFVTSAGILGTETTIGGFAGYEPRLPVSCRIRQAMQYGSSLDDYVRILLDGNSGDYANSWLLGDVRGNEILRLELGLRFHRVERTTNGHFIGFNATYDPRIRNLECVSSGFDDVRRHQGARRVRLGELMRDWKGRLDLAAAEAILADHYDVYLRKADNPCSRTCCAHYELDAREFMSDPARPKPFQPRGALDGNVIDSALARQMAMRLRWGSSCGRAFDRDAFCDQNAVWDDLRPYLHSRPSQPWVTIWGVSAETRNKHGTRQTQRTRRAKRKRRTRQKRRRSV